MLSSYKKLTGKTLVGSLKFVNTWQTFLNDPSLFGSETSTGPYAGLLDGFNRGVVYRERYGHLWNGTGLPIFTSGFVRIIETARRFGEGFLGNNYSTSGYINIIPEIGGQGANSFSPTCYTSTKSSSYSMSSFKQFSVAADRLNQENGLKLTVSDVYNLMLHAPFELNARPSSPWINVFTLDEWIAFGYYNDLGYYYGSGGAGTNTSVPVGSVYANATLTLLNDPNAGKLFFSFCHDSNITPILAALKVLIPNSSLPTDHIQQDSIFKSGNIVPMGGHLVLERLQCNASSQYPRGTYVRTIVNEAVIPRQDCQSGPGYSCPLQQYTEDLQNNLSDYVSKCKVPAYLPQYLSFFWHFNQTTTFNYRRGDAKGHQGYTSWDDQPI